MACRPVRAARGIRVLFAHSRARHGPDGLILCQSTASQTCYVHRWTKSFAASRRCPRRWFVRRLGTCGEPALCRRASTSSALPSCERCHSCTMVRCVWSWWRCAGAHGRAGLRWPCWRPSSGCACGRAPTNHMQACAAPDIGAATGRHAATGSAATRAGPARLALRGRRGSDRLQP